MLRALQHGVMSELWIQALVVNTVLIALAQRTTLLTRSGWVHAAALGTILWGLSLIHISEPTRPY